jgi:phenylacetate-coenzyme A ligase PaaK-like adenylate-forming protein
MIWNPDAETARTSDLARLQDARMREVVSRVHTRVPFYRERLDSAGLSEVIGPGVAAECEARAGLHIQEDHFYPEVVDPATGAPLPPGGQGELVLTALTKEATPLLRYRTLPKSEGKAIRVVDRRRKE